MTTAFRLAAALVVLLCAVPCHAQSGSAGADGYPNRPVRVLLPFPPGGVVDVMGRLLAQKLSDRLGQNFYVENHGAAAAISALRWCRPHRPTAIRC
jgi:tripartite-type tricarboxylate transporter receptor subunit TctC